MHEILLADFGDLFTIFPKFQNFLLFFPHMLRTEKSPGNFKWYYNGLMLFLQHWGTFLSQCVQLYQNQPFQTLPKMWDRIRKFWLLWHVEHSLWECISWIFQRLKRVKNAGIYSCVDILPRNNKNTLKFDFVSRVNKNNLL